jgi:hypothetical protein
LELDRETPLRGTPTAKTLQFIYIFIKAYFNKNVNAAKRRDPHKPGFSGGEYRASRVTSPPHLL